MDFALEDDLDVIGVAMILFRVGGDFSLKNEVLHHIACGGGGTITTRPLELVLPRQKGTKSRTTPSDALVFVVQLFLGPNSSLQQHLLQEVFQASDWHV